MDSKQHLYYAIGIMAYAVAKADGEVQAEEKDKLAEIINANIEHAFDFDYANIIFQILENDNKSIDGICGWVQNALETGKHYLTPELREKIKALLTEVASSFPPTTQNEMKVKDALIKVMDGIKAVNLPLG